MASATARYSVCIGLAGGYLPNTSYSVECNSFRDFCNAIKSAIDEAGFPAYRFGDAKVRSRWHFIKRNGSSSAHFAIYHGDDVVEFQGLTEAEFAASQAQ